MKRIALISATLMALVAFSTAEAQVKISELPAGAALGGTEAVPAVQSGNTVKTTPAAVSAYTIGQLSAGDVVGKFTGTCNGSTLLAGNGTCVAAGASQSVTDISGTVTVNGLTSITIQQVNVVLTGKVVTMFLWLQGTSNATTFSVSGIPAQFVPAAAVRGVLVRGDNGTQGYGSFNMGTGGTLDLYPDPASGAWTSSGIKSIQRAVLTWIVP